MKPKEWLFQNGHIKEIGRGRLSREHIDLIKDAVNHGAMIEGYSVESTPNSTVKTVVKTDKPASDVVWDIGAPLRDERTIEATAAGKTIGMRTVCQICGNSLTYCPCNNPKVWVDHDHQDVVKFATRKQPMTPRWF